MSRIVEHHENPSVPIERVDNAFVALNNLVLDSKTRKSYNESPVLHTILTQDNGIEITGTFKTNDATTDGQFSYVTVRKQHNSPIAWDGLGFAWRKGDGSDYNVYIVDNNALEEDVIMMGEQVVQTGGINKFLAAGKCTITANSTYYFKMTINEYNSVAVYIDDADATTKIVEIGPTWDSVYTPAANGTDFGVSVLTSRGYSWWYDTIQISSTLSNWSNVLLKFYTPSSQISDTQQANVYINAIGTWNINTCSGLTALIYNVDNSAYELLETRYDSLMSEGIIEVTTASGISSYRDTSDYVNVLLTTVSGYDDATISLNYAYIDNILLSGIHTGNFVDIYVNSPDDITFDTVEDVSVSDDQVSLTADNFTLPVAQVDAVRLNATGDDLEFKVMPNTKSFYGSTSTDAYIQLYSDYIAGTIDIDYRYLLTGSGMQALVQTSEFRGLGQSNLIKTMPMILINFDTVLYTGGPDLEVLKTKLKDWVNALDTSFEVTDLIAYMYQLGVQYIDLTTFKIKYTKYNTVGTRLVNGAELVSSYTLDSLENFYTDTNEMAGIIRTA